MQAVEGVRRAVLAALIAMVGVNGGVLGLGAQTPEGYQPEFEPNLYEPMLIDAVIDVSGPAFHIEDVNFQSYNEGENEQVLITGEIEGDEESVPAILEISFFDDEDTPDQTIELWINGLAQGMDELEIVDSGLDGDVTWYYVVAEYQGEGQVYYVQVQQDVEENVDVLQSVLTIDGSMQDVLVAAQGEVSIGDTPFMEDVDPDEMQQLLDGEPFREGEVD